MEGKFRVAYLTIEEYTQNHSIARGFYKGGAEPDFAENYLGEVTAGYGRLDEDGYFEFSLEVDQETGKIDELFTEDF